MITRARTIAAYWGRKAGSIGEPYVLAHSRRGSLVLDSFGGAGSIVKTALANDRRAIYSDLSPVASLIARAEIEGVEPESLQRAWHELASRLQVRRPARPGKLQDRSHEFIELCRCGLQANVLYYLWRGGTRVGAKVSCSCGRKYLDASHLVPERVDCRNYAPGNRLWYDDGTFFKKKRQVDEISELYTEKNSLILSRIKRNIDRLETERRTKNALRAAFVSILYQSSKMSRPGAGPWGINSYWIPRTHAERNPYLLFDFAIERVARLQGLAVGGTVESVLRGESRVAFLRRDARFLPLPDHSIDMAITDPPFGDEIQYFELSYLAASWLGVSMPFSREIVVNPKQAKSVGRYLEDLSKAFLELNRVLKKQGRAVFMLHDEEQEMLLEMGEAVVSAGFKINRQDTTIMPQRQIGDRDERHGMELQILSCSKQ